ncbi:MAG: efflux RND transporter periplasmic adaptor subunit [Ignavibacteria bacterium]|nr:efflux RND transporter periplasmic adaptor subunit [Ignavibacteria bacterium]
MKISLKIVLIAFAIFFTAVMIYSFLPDTENQEKDESASINYDKLDEIIFDVKTTKVIKGSLEKAITANGIVKAYKELEITSNVNGYIKNINVFEGKTILENDLLLALDDREYNLALKDAEVKVTQARVEYGFLMKSYTEDSSAIKKAQKIERKIAVVNEEYKNSKINDVRYNELIDSLELALLFTGAKREELVLNSSGLTSAMNAVKKARLNLEYTKITAPFSGVIGDFNLVVGQRINAGAKLLKLFNVSKLLIDVGILESEILDLVIGSSAEIQFPAIPGKVFHGTVKYISPYIDANTKTCTVTLVFDNKNNLIKSGMFANVKLVSKVLEDIILIPKEALLVRDGRNLVFVAENSLAKWRYVEIGDQNDKYIEILEGVFPDEDIIYQGHFTLAHDSRIKIIK